MHLSAAEHGFSEEQVAELTTKLKERGLVNFLRDYLTPTEPDAPQPSLRKLLLSFGFFPPSHLLHTTSNVAWLPYAKLALSRMLRHRQKLLHINTVQDAVNLLRDAKKVIVLSGAGISTSCGIPDFRSASGLYAQLQAEGKYDLDEPQDMFDIRVFRERPEIFYSFAKQIYPSNFTPSPCHRWIRSLEDRGILLRNYTQNIDTLESSAGVKRVLQCHGSFSTASCLRCKTRVPGKTIEPYIMSQQIPFCGTCRQARDVEIAARQERKEAKKRGKGKGKVKATEWDDDSDSSEISEWGAESRPDIVFFGQALDSEFDELLFLDRDEVDLLVIIGTSLKVAPVAEVLTHIPHSVPQIFINLTPVNHVKPDICLIGDADSIVTYLSHQLGWDLPPPTAVLHSPKADGKPDVQHDAIRLPTREPLDPEDVAWISGSEDL
ncbi:DHS-like NAD/FAD-binding domain-containing protein [Kockovaella imperatae]|uniref:DHS-like NAD/FAD-binding domain-containing protein n=1 Tax=Kockovaella imperatae TaxID=4999 RepID=A0A1Y1U7S9_9TREE|nr:DHS-like NAD/FAD-binding domain-containing protein [Kockovaella imperatae]ORX34063.1 DHS-like NAD/FAD-binding domain-containing protein [Kockovaella imperatae]